MAEELATPGSTDEGREQTFLRISSASAWSLSDSGSTWDMQEPIEIARRGRKKVG